MRKNNKPMYAMPSNPFGNPPITLEEYLALIFDVKKPLSKEVDKTSDN